MTDWGHLKSGKHKQPEQIHENICLKSLECHIHHLHEFLKIQKRNTGCKPQIKCVPIVPPKTCLLQEQNVSQLYHRKHVYYRNKICHNCTTENMSTTGTKCVTIAPPKTCLLQEQNVSQLHHRKHVYYRNKAEQSDIDYQLNNQLMTWSFVLCPCFINIQIV